MNIQQIEYSYFKEIIVLFHKKPRGNLIVITKKNPEINQIKNNGCTERFSKQKLYTCEPKNKIFYRN